MKNKTENYLSHGLDHLTQYEQEKLKRDGYSFEQWLLITNMEIDRFKKIKKMISFINSKHNKPIII